MGAEERESHKPHRAIQPIAGKPENNCDRNWVSGQKNKRMSNESKVDNRVDTSYI